MRGRIAALLVLATLAMPAAHASPRCPSIADEAGDTGFVVGIADDANDLTAVNLSSSTKQLAVSLTVVGQPGGAETGTARVYEVYFDTGEGSYAFRASLGNVESRYELVSNARTDVPGGSVNSFSTIKSINGRVGQHVVAMTASLDRDLPLLGRRVTVFARTWRLVGEAVDVAGTRTPSGLTWTLDDTDAVGFRVGDRGCAAS
jgi:hypothetical protein